MRRSVSKPTAPSAVALQVACLLAVASGLVGVLISDINRQKSTIKVERPAHVQLDASPSRTNAGPR